MSFVTPSRQGSNVRRYSRRIPHSDRTTSASALASEPVSTPIASTDRIAESLAERPAFLDLGYEVRPDPELNQASNIPSVEDYGMIRTAGFGSELKQGQLDSTAPFDITQELQRLDLDLNLNLEPLDVKHGNGNANSRAKTVKDGSGGGHGYGHHRKKIPNSFLSSFRIHEALVENLQILPEKLVHDLNRWVTCFVLVQFDVDVGPDLKIIRPAIRFSEEEFKTICFSSLPEHTSNNNGEDDDNIDRINQFHTFRFVHGTTTMYANCFFSQCRDSSSSRGYLQESLVIISRHYFPSLFQSCLNEIMAPHNSFLNCSLDSKVPLLDTAINNIAQWPDVAYDKQLELGFLGSVIETTLPQKILVNPLSNQNILESWEHTFISMFQDLSDLYTLYECLLLGRPIIVYAPSPHLCSTFIHTIVDLIRPVPYNRNIREYVTIHSFPTNFSEGIIGFTNPFLLKGIDSTSAQPRSENLAPSTLNSISTSIPSTVVAEASSEIVDRPSVPFVFLLSNSMSASADPQLEEEKKLRNLVKHSNRSITKNRYLMPDYKFLASISMAMTAKPDPNANSIDHLIRFHFATLTSRLISPLSAYFGTHLEFNDRIFHRELAKEDWNSNLNKLFNVHSSQTMLHKISARASFFTSVSRTTTTTCKQLFYREFVSSPNMALWLKGNGVSRRDIDATLPPPTSPQSPKTPKTPTRKLYFL
ncbi:hypothetical protein AWJ20_3382 [Sugiyamaella lignohabitans]|uniref:UDENN domain-containing protein n=1 Tax=Sugiyamaella lignohabitans TaxID=796027 RepID=A0A167FV55_9ASCO|nr:uncharacterized protein AWJ20_3382 [Sugiyamaella lignohabitans]ANB15741.1 hypothetical protein AWJ20_3382 [Sugiyamaella lignohabitans]